MSSPFDASPSRWNDTAPFIRDLISSFVEAVAAHPGMSGEYAEYPVAVFSITIKYLIAYHLTEDAL